mmetsp:Transcript_19337/g.39507  ORF Transcript_19337/g.39507 Transcript_19337/m.39507 type:complete len:772 (+) Transcript_19337:67-2382(+)
MSATTTSNTDPRHPYPTPPQTINPDLAAERASAPFSPLRITHFLDGGSASLTDRRRRLEALIIRDTSGVFSNDDNHYLHRTERHTRALAKFVRLVELCRAAGIGSHPRPPALEGEITSTKEFQTLVATLSDDPLPTSLHWVMFVPNILTLCDAEQQSLWLPLCRDFKMIGCYAQTELGHGSNIRALETTATFLKEIDGGAEGGEWVVHSPTLTSAKFWPGTLGKTANHAMVIARLIDGEGIDRGIHNFLVPLRSMEDHSLLEGVETGDVGPKIGYNNMDNGFCRFDHVRIPRRNMAMRFATVDEEGVYRKVEGGASEAASKVAYITMMQVRAYIIHSSNEALAMACTIAIRYSTVRRQGYNADENDANNSPAEFQVLDYRQQQYRLLPLLAASYAIFFTGRHVLSRLNRIEQQLVSGAKSITKTVVGDIHSTTSALKSYVTTFTADGIEDCRKACGGHGFLMCSGLVELSNTYLQSCTVEGDNQMLPQQVIKVLLKLVGVIQSGDEAALKDYEATDMQYLIQPLQSLMQSNDDISGDGPSKSTFSFPANTSESDFLSILTLLQAYQHRTACLLLDVTTQLQTSLSDSHATQQKAWNDALLSMARASRAHACYILLRDFSDGLEEEKAKGSKSCLGPEEIQVLSQCLVLLGLYWMDQHLSDFLQIGVVSSKQIPVLRRALLRVMTDLRPSAVALCDARDFADFRLKSALGKYDGDVYPAIMEAARRDPLNVKSNEKGVGLGYEESLKKLIVDGVGEYRGKKNGGVSGTASRL